MAAGIKAQNDPNAKATTALTRREQQVLCYLAVGRSNKFMAYELGVSQSNISECIRRARAKFCMRSTAELIRLVGQLLSAATPEQSQRSSDKLGR